MTDLETVELAARRASDFLMERNIMGGAALDRFATELTLILQERSEASKKGKK